MKYQFKATEAFWENFYDLPPEQKLSVRNAWQKFKMDPFDPSLRPHKIHSLSAQYGRTIYAVEVEGDLRSVFFVDGNTIWTVDIGTHSIYRT